MNCDKVLVPLKSRAKKMIVVITGGHSKQGTYGTDKKQKTTFLHFYIFLRTIFGPVYYGPPGIKGDRGWTP